MQKDVVVGAITNYNYDVIKPWVNSLVRSGFSGDKIMFCYNISFDVCDKLSQQGFKIFGFEQNEEQRCLEYTKPNFNVVVERFHHMAFILRGLQEKYRYLIATDVKDVIFQQNPSVWLEKNMGSYKVNAASESIRYEDETWGNHNLYASFGIPTYQLFKDKVISNAGVMSGNFEYMLDLFLHIQYLCDAAPSHSIPGGGGPDQAAYNICINSLPWWSITRFTQSEEGWAAQLGTTGPQINERFGNFLTEKTPIINNGLVCTSTGIPFTVVHQYDRVPEWSNEIRNLYL